MRLVNYQLIADALHYYQGSGYKRVNVPWTVSKPVLAITCKEDHDFEDNRYLDKYLVGSAEQSFLQLMKDGLLPFGKYCAATPCFRNDEIDELHQKYFMKVELFYNINPSDSREWVEVYLNKMVEDAKRFFRIYSSHVSVVETKDIRSALSYDIEIDGVEIGSYGIRWREGLYWIYGTGLAEPRFSDAILKRIWRISG